MRRRPTRRRSLLDAPRRPRCRRLRSKTRFTSPSVRRPQMASMRSAARSGYRAATMSSTSR
ncbi:MAG TPA: hypothetical protein EYM36_08340 [Acidobacteria bacterium]|nr:hypothetical protein [Acidobacteriota bacterium]